jgi:hypothetical protein
MTCKDDSSGFNSLRIGSSGELMNEPSGSLKGGEFLDCLSNYQFSRAVLHGHN